jgi:hypothetical protein
MVEIVAPQTALFFVILFAVPLQFYFSPRSSSDAKFYFYK